MAGLFCLCNRTPHNPYLDSVRVTLGSILNPLIQSKVKVPENYHKVICKPFLTRFQLQSLHLFLVRIGHEVRPDSYCWFSAIGWLSLDCRLEDTSTMDRIGLRTNRPILTRHHHHFCESFKFLSNSCSVTFLSAHYWNPGPSGSSTSMVLKDSAVVWMPGDRQSLPRPRLSKGQMAFVWSSSFHFKLIILSVVFWPC